MAINLVKTKCRMISSWQCIAKLERKLHFEIDGKEIENVEYAKLLGVQRIKKYFTHHTRILFYDAYVQPLWGFRRAAWGSKSKESLDCLLRLQKCAA